MADLSAESERRLALLGRFLKLKALEMVPLDERVEAFNRLVAKYAEEHRRYHVLDHIYDGFKMLDLFRHLARQPDDVALAWFYHDVVYDIGVPKRQNERRSAGFLASELLSMGVEPPEVVYPAALILSTTHDHQPQFNDGRLIVDIDLTGLGAPWPVFLQNNRNVRQEYKDVPEEAFRKGNGEVLGSFLERSPLYRFPEIEACFGDQAKENLRRWLQRP